MLNIAAYQFVRLDDIDALMARLRASAQSRALRGTILVAPEGINLFLAGHTDAMASFVHELRGDARFAGMPVKYSHSHDCPFARLKVKRKREIIAFGHEQASPLAQGHRAPAISAPTLRRWMDQGHDDQGRRLLLLDTRNREEVAYGSFAGAMSLPIDNFTELPEAVAEHRDELADAAVVSFCTGGIRCEKAALWMQAQGISHVYQLDGGILGYFEQVGGAGYEGRCFVFDARVALDPALEPLHDTVSPAPA